jgi:hypothetical protein
MSYLIVSSGSKNRYFIGKIRISMEVSIYGFVFRPGPDLL